MAGNKNPWRDIASPNEWQFIKDFADPPVARGRPLPKPPPKPGALPAPQGGPPLLDRIGTQISEYDVIAKDQSALFPQRIAKLDLIANLGAQYVNEFRRENVSNTSSPGGKALGDKLDVWTSSLAHRAAKKSGYLTAMAQWHQTAKAKYKDRVQMSIFLRALAEGGHVRNAGEKLHATPYATIEKIDPYHRQTFVFLDPNDATANDDAVNLMGEAFVEYLNGTMLPGASNATPSFYEWLECHPFCIGTPGILGDDKFKRPARISYGGHDLTNVRVTQSSMIAEQVISAPGVWTNLNTSILPQSGKGPPNAAAFVWDGDCNLYLHAHGLDGFVHASAKQGGKIRCSGMLVAANGLVTYISNMSGHYAPNAQSLYNFARWLNARKCARPDAVVEIEHGAPPLDGRIAFASFLNLGAQQGLTAPVALPYP